MNTIDVALRAIQRVILGPLKSAPVEILYAELGLETCVTRRDWLMARYILSLSDKLLNATYSTT